MYSSCGSALLAVSVNSGVQSHRLLTFWKLRGGRRSTFWIKYRKKYPQEEKIYFFLSTADYFSLMVSKNWITLEIKLSNLLETFGYCKNFFTQLRCDLFVSRKIHTDIAFMHNVFITFVWCLALAFDLDVIAWTGAGLSTPSARANRTSSDLYKGFNPFKTAINKLFAL